MSTLAVAGLVLKGVEEPESLTGLGIEGEHARSWRGTVQNAIDDEWIALNFAATTRRQITRTKLPDFFEQVDIFPSNLRQS